MRQLVVVALLVLTGCAASEQDRPAAPPRSTPPSPSAPQPPAVTVQVDGWWAWALLDRRTGRTTGSANRESQTTTESMVKAWLAADYLTGRSDLTRPELNAVRDAIRASDDPAAEWLYQARDGDHAIQRMIATCRLTRTRVRSGNWALTRITATDAARLGGCLADGTAAGPQWTDWLLYEMRQVTPSGDFGIRDAFPPQVAGRIAVKNGWTPRSGTWHVNCLGIWDRWSLAVLLRYPAGHGLGYGARVCRDVTRQLFTGTGQAGGQPTRPTTIQQSYRLFGCTRSQ